MKKPNRRRGPARFLTPDQHRELLALRDEGVHPLKLARRFGISFPNVYIYFKREVDEDDPRHGAPK